MQSRALLGQMEKLEYGLLSISILNFLITALWLYKRISLFLGNTK